MTSSWAIRSGSIPACAGEPKGNCEVATGLRVYPCVRGGTRRQECTCRYSAGLSPRARGNRCPSGSLRIERVYPRVRGGTKTDPRVRGGTGCPVSPRARGNRIQDTNLIAARVYPRVRGGTGCQDTVAHCRKGLSPRARGNPRRSGNSGLPDGSIPACAGEPDKSSASRGLNRVYPRVRGVTASTPRPASSPAGLSPRARGNPPFPAPRPDFEGSIPACAGEPCRRS